MLQLVLLRGYEDQGVFIKGRSSWKCREVSLVTRRSSSTEATSATGATRTNYCPESAEAPHAFAACGDGGRIACRSETTGRTGVNDRVALLPPCETGVIILELA